MLMAATGAFHSVVLPLPYTVGEHHAEASTDLLGQQLEELIEWVGVVAVTGVSYPEVPDSIMNLRRIVGRRLGDADSVGKADEPDGRRGEVKLTNECLGGALRFG